MSWELPDPPRDEDFDNAGATAAWSPSTAIAYVKAHPPEQRRMRRWWCGFWYGHFGLYVGPETVCRRCGKPRF